MEPARAPRPVLLAVDDHASIHDALQLVLDDEYDVLSATTGEAALREIERRRVDLILLDLVMPGLDGWQVFEHVRQRPHPPKVIFLTGIDSSAAAVYAIQLGAIGWIIKPFEEPALLMQLRSLLPTARSLRPLGGELGTRGAIAVIASMSCGLQVDYRAPAPVPSPEGQAFVLDAGRAASDIGLAALLSQPPLGLALSPATAAAVHHVSQHYSDVSVESLADAVGLSTNSLRKLFRLDLNLNPKEFIARVRVEVVKQRRLQPGSPSLERLAEEVGFCDGPHLSHVLGRYAQDAARRAMEIYKPRMETYID